MNFAQNKAHLLLIILALNALNVFSQYLEEEVIDETVEIAETFTDENIMCRNEITGEQVDW